MAQVELWEAVALSVDMDPDQLPVYLGAYDRYGDDPFRICPPVFLDRLAIAVSNYGKGFKGLKVHALRPRCIVELSEYGAWVQASIGALPTEFPATKPTVASKPRIQGNGPDYWTLRNAAIAIQAEHQLDDEEREQLLAELLDAAKAGALTVRDPYSGAHCSSSTVTDQFELVTNDDVNNWFDADDHHLRWGVSAAGLQRPENSRHPISVPDETVSDSAPSTPAPPPQSTVDGIPTREIAVIFGGIMFEQHRWGRNLSSLKWLEPAQLSRGAQGGASATWCPATLGRLIVERTKGQSTRQRILKAVNNRFAKYPMLAPWKSEWDGYFDAFYDAD